jgi:uncharacterized membrane protein YeaQ/YmgE (transglycosylase-associated protein family)
MTLASFLFGMLLSSLYGTLFHLVRGGGFGRLLLYIILAWVGFWAGQALASFLGWTFISVGPLHLAMATLFSLIFLVVGYWLSLVDTQGK